MDHISSEAMRAYLLGQLSDDEATALEEAYFVNRPFLLKLQSEETALIADYLEGSLKSGEKRSFEKLYLQVPDLQRKVEEARRQRNTLAQAARPSIWPRWRLGFAAALGVVLGIGIWMYNVHQKGRVQISSHVEPPTPVMPPQSEKQTPSRAAMAVYLVPGVTQGTGSQVREFKQQLNTDDLYLILELPGQTSAVEAKIEIWSVDSNERLKLAWNSQNPVPSVSSSLANELPKTERQPSVHQVLRLSFPGSFFQPGDYEVKAWPAHHKPHETYLFRVLPGDNPTPQ